MSVSLVKGQKVSLAKKDERLSVVVVGLGWDEVKRKGGFFSKPAPIDCDASAIILQNKKLARTEDVIYYGNLAHKTHAVVHLGDNLTGAGDGDDEQIIVKLEELPSTHDTITFVVNIYKAIERKQHFGLIENAFVRIVDGRNNTEICRYNLTDDYSNMTAIVFGEIYKHNDEWKFNAIGQGTQDKGLNEIIQRYTN
ncbi:MAG: stress protein [Epulopiscium sp. Nele67-Bin005]|nr:MAG: stress protein [Epulopiscium sp. Nele67-Bin005]